MTESTKLHHSAERAAAPRRSSTALRITWVLEVLLAALCIPALWMDALVLPILCATLLLVEQLRSALQHGLIWQRSFVFCFSLGNLGCMVYANAAYVLLTTLPQYGDHTLSMWFTIGHVFAAMVGCRLVELVLPRTPHPIPVYGQQDVSSWQALAITGFIYAALTVLTFFVAGDTRWNPEEASSATVFAQGIGRIADLFFFVLGYRLQPNFLKPRNLGLLLLAGVLALTNGLVRGYREPVVISLLTFTVGALVRAQALPVLRRQLVVAGLIALPVFALYWQAVGSARDEFADKGIVERIVLTLTEVDRNKGAEADDANENMVARLFEPSGQDVIARLANTDGHDAGFEHFERLIYLLVPRFLAPEKQTAGVGPEILARDFHYYNIDELTHIPITLVADCYRRGGLLWVLAVGFFTGIVLRLEYLLTRKLAKGPMFDAIIAATAVRYIRLYPYSVPALITFVSWYWLKDVFMFASIGVLILASQSFMRRRSKASQPGSASSTGRRLTATQAKPS